MKIKTIGIDKNIEVGDEVKFVLETRDGSNCLIDPYQVVDLKIYFINREFTDSNSSEYRVGFDNPELVAEFKKTKEAICIKSKESVSAATVEEISLFGLQEIDGISLLEGDRVLVKNQSNLVENGIYVVSDSSWSRSDDALKIVCGMYVFVDNGISNIGTGWVVETNNPIVVGTTPVKFIKFANEWFPKSPDKKEEENYRKLEDLKVQIEASKLKSSFYYKDAEVIKKIGGEIDSSGEFFPAWLNPEFVSSNFKSKVISDNILSKAEDSNGVIPGVFVFDWDTSGLREGDYFICWTWRPTIGDSTLSSHIFFNLEGNNKSTSSIPTHRVKPDKYEKLLERYTPEMFKTRLSNTDISPEVLSEFNKAIAKGFMFVENQANSVIDLLDANSTQEKLLPLLSNMFNIALKSGDPALWRRQIKKAIPNFKKKGSIVGLREAFGDSGMKLIKLSRLWQVVPKYTHQEHFVYSGFNEFYLTKNLILDCNFKLWRKNSDESSWTDLTAVCDPSASNHWSLSFVEISENLMTWVGQEELKNGDLIRVQYATGEIPSNEQAKEDYIRSLPLLDDRDERDQEYPLKNWNVHLIEEDDENFEVLIPVRHPFSYPIIWGRIRTEFPYSENLYNMEEYNGSTRDSINPCDIDKSFLDSCGQCASSKFNINIEIEDLSDERIIEAQKIVEEYMPFHAIPNSFNFWGSNNEFVKSSEEKIEAMIMFSQKDTTLSGEGQHIFSRNVYESCQKNSLNSSSSCDFASDLDSVLRNLLASMTALENSSGSVDWLGTIKNNRTVLLSSVELDENDVFNDSFSNLSSGFESLNIDTSISNNSNSFENSNLLEVLGTSTRTYSISSINNSIAVINKSVDSIFTNSLFEYRISNKIADLNIKIDQYEEVLFSDENTDFSITGIITQYDIESGDSSSEPWRLLFEDKEYLIKNILPDGNLLLTEIGPISTISGWRLMRGSNVEKEGFLGSKTINGYGLVEINSPSNITTRDLFKIGDVLYLDVQSVPKTYEIRSFQKDSNKFYIKEYHEGNIGGEDAKVYRRVLDKKIGQFEYDQLILISDENLETKLIIDEDNKKENYILFIKGEYYTISEVEGNTIKLIGPYNNYDTNGISTSFNIYKFSKERLKLSEKQDPPYDIKPNVHKFYSIDRSGGFILSGTEGMSGEVVSSLLNSSEAIDIMSHNERIDFKIEYKGENK